MINIFNEVKQLNFPIDQYLVVGGGAMMARGIKETFDIDLVALPELFKKCQEMGWKEHLRPNGEPGFENGIFEIYLDVNCDKFNPTFSELYERAEIINGVPFCSLSDVIKFKQVYNREKDIKDIKLVEEYLLKK
jgi:hypothetical protein